MQEPQTDYAAIRRPVSEARGLPNRHYTDAATHDAETRRLFHQQWCGLGVAAQVAEPGDAVPIEFLNIPLLLVRDKQGQLRVFQNICRHRGMILVAEPRRIEGAIRCPYHSWCYGTDGRLVATPHVGGPGQNSTPSIDRDELGLIEVRSHIWRDVVWINLSGSAPPFEEAQADLIARWADFDTAIFHGGQDSAFTLNVASNWKLAVENYCESYHLPWIHPGLNAYSRLEDHYNIEMPGHYSGQGTRVYRQLTTDDGKVFPDFPGVGAKWNSAAEYASVYPNVLMGVHRDHAFIIILHPLAQDQTAEHVHLYYAAPDVDDAMKTANATLWRDVFREDILVVEGMQKGRKAPGFDGGRFSPVMDAPTHCFHDWVAAQMQGATAK